MRLCESFSNRHFSRSFAYVSLENSSICEHRCSTFDHNSAVAQQCSDVSSFCSQTNSNHVAPAAHISAAWPSNPYCNTSGARYPLVPPPFLAIQGSCNAWPRSIKIILCVPVCVNIGDTNMLAGLISPCITPLECTPCRAISSCRMYHFANAAF